MTWYLVSFPCNTCNGTLHLLGHSFVVEDATAWKLTP